MIIAKWGNSLAVRIPADVVRALHLKEGDEVDLLRTDDGHLAVITEEQRAAALKDLRGFRESLPPDYSFNRNEANAR